MPLPFAYTIDQSAPTRQSFARQSFAPTEVDIMRAKTPAQVDELFGKYVTLRVRLNRSRSHGLLIQKPLEARANHGDMGGMDADDPNGLKLGTKVAITSDDYGFDPVVGKVVSTSVYEVAIEREEPSLGKIVNHFPKVGFRITLT